MRLSNRVLIPEKAILDRVSAMAAAISADTPEDATVSVLAILDGAFMFCADLVRRLTVPVHLAMVPLTSVRRGGDPGRISLPLDFPVEGAEILVVEDILDSGRTLHALRERLAARRPRRVRLAVLLDKPAGREVGIVPDYVGFTVPDRWVVGYGLDADGRYRNLPYVTYIE
jgi:hypoxanthine phosphoribosyltransferase